MIAALPRLTDERSSPVEVSRSALSLVAEDGLAACRNAADAIARAIDALVADQPVALHQLQRAAFELQELAPSLAGFAYIADPTQPT